MPSHRYDDTAAVVQERADAGGEQGWGAGAIFTGSPRVPAAVDIKIGLDDRGVTRHFALKPSARLSCEFDFGSDAKRHEDFVCGRPVPFSPGEIAIDSPLFNLGEGGEIRVGSDLDATVLMTATDDPHKRLILSGTMVSGIEGGQFETDPGPIRFQYQFRFAGEHATIGAHLSLDLKYWHGKPITELERFDELDRFFGMGERRSVEIQWIINRMPGEPGTMQMPRLSDQWCHLLVGIRKAREIARKIGIVPVLPEGFGEAHKKSIDKIHALLFDGEYHASAPHGSFTMTTSPLEAKPLLAHVGKNRSTASMKGFFPEHDSFLGHPIVVVMNEVALTWARPRRRRSSKDSVEVTFSGTSRSEMIYRSAKEVLSVEEANRRFGRVEPEPQSVHLDPH